MLVCLVWFVVGLGWLLFPRLVILAGWLAAWLLGGLFAVGTRGQAMFLPVGDGYLVLLLVEPNKS